jgi:SSS family solute:Na+ symporter
MPVIGHEKLLTHRLGIPFLMQAWWMFCLCSLIFVVVSLLTPRPDPSQVEAMTWRNPLQVIAGGRIKGFSDPRLWAGVLLAIVAVLYYLLR